MHKTLLFLCCCILFSIQAPQSIAQIIEDERSITEVIGLKRWTLERLQKHIRQIDSTLKLAMCAAKLEQSGFPEASMFATRDKETNKIYMALTIIEPEDSSFIHRRTTYTQQYTLPKQFYAVKEQMPRNVNIVTDIVVHHFDSTYYSSEMDTSQFRQLCKHIKELDIRPTLLENIVKSDKDSLNRSLALVLLSREAHRNEALQSFIAALRDRFDPNGGIASTAILSLLNKQTTIHVQWSELYEDMKAVANGTHLECYHVLLRVLAAAKLSLRDFDEIFSTQHSRELLVAHLRAKKYTAVQKPLLMMMNLLQKDFSTMSSSEQERCILGKFMH